MSTISTSSLAVIAFAIMGLSCGGSRTALSPCGPVCSASSFVYGTTSGTSQVLFFPVAQNGTLSSPASLPGPALSAGITVSLSRELFVADHIQGKLYTYVRNSSNQYSAGPGSPYQIASGPGLEGIALTPDSKSLYVEDFNQGVFGYSIAADGSLTLIPGSPFGGGGYAQPVVDGTGKFLILAGPIAVTVLQIDSTTGALHPTGNFVTLPASSLITTGMAAMAPGTNYLYVALASANAIAAYAMDTTSGALTLVSGSPFTAGQLPLTLTASQSGTLYVVNSGDSTLSALSIDKNTGSLTAVPGSPFSAAWAGGVPAILSSQYFYVASVNNIFSPTVNAVLGYSIGSGGSLTPLNGSPFPTGAQLRGGLAAF